MSIYKNCGVFGFFKPVVTREEFKAAGYQPDKFEASCGFLGLGFNPKAATFEDVPQSLLDDCVPPGGAKPGSKYEVTAPGVCSAQDCAAGTVRVKGKCVTPGMSCVPADPQPHASYSYASSGACALSSCGVGTVERKRNGISNMGSGACPVGYEAISKGKECKAAAERYGIKYNSEVNESGLLAGCVVHTAKGSKTGVASFNTNAKGVAASGEQFIVCGRSDVNPCVTVGALCGGAPNYRYNSDGFCQGSCEKLSEPCKKGEKCCGDGVCISSGQDCPETAKLKADAKNIADQIHGIAASFQQVSSSLHHPKKK